MRWKRMSKKNDAEAIFERLAYYLNDIRELMTPDLQDDIGKVRRLETDLIRAAYWANRYLITRFFSNSNKKSEEEEEEGRDKEWWKRRNTGKYRR
jgi:hypothetical protein